MYSLGLFVLWYLLKASLLGSVFNASPDALHLLDIGVCKGVLGSLAGTHLAHSLGAAWLPWLALWVAWCGAQVALGARPLRTPAALAACVMLAVVGPLVMAVAPFSPSCVRLQGAALVAVPGLGRLPTLLDLALPAGR
jgi:hypothetical protein